MIRTIVITDNLNIKLDIPLEEIEKENLLWYWVDLCEPTEEEALLLEERFKFHPLAIEDCRNSRNSAKFDHYKEYDFFILNAINKKSLQSEDIGLFVNSKYVVSYHRAALIEIEDAMDRVKKNRNRWSKGTAYVAHQIMDKVVDHFFPTIYDIEEKLDDIEINDEGEKLNILVDKLFKIRKDLGKIRKTVNAMRDLLYRIINSEKLQDFNEHKMYFSDIHDHLLKLSGMVEASREMTADIRDNYLSMNSVKLNRNTMVLAVVTTIFNPLTFIVGVYGMNFQYMPELNFKYGYFIVLILMVIIAVAMYKWFKSNGWMDV